MINFMIIVWLYLAALVGTLIHEVGHFGKIKMSLIPTNAVTWDAKVFGFYAMIPELIVLIAISYYKPNLIFLNYVALMLYIHVIYSMILGYSGFSINKYGFVNDNYKNKFSLTVGIILVVYYFSIYVPFGIQIFKSVFGI